MALFNNLDIADVVAEAQRHNSRVLEDELQPYNDMLFKIISDGIKAKHDNILEHFKTRIRLAPRYIKVVSVPFWAYNVRYFRQSREEYAATLRAVPYTERYARVNDDQERDSVYRSNGWHWTIGALSPVQWLDEEETWKLRPVPVDLVVRRTDLCQRLSTLFQGHVWVAREYHGTIHEDAHCEVRSFALVAKFYVDGIGDRPAWVDALKRTTTKYSAHVIEEEDYLSPNVVLTGPGLAPPRTPPTSPVRPPAPKRLRCASCDFRYDSE